MSNDNLNTECKRYYALKPDNEGDNENASPYRTIIWQSQVISARGPQWSQSVK